MLWCRRGPEEGRCGKKGETYFARSAATDPGCAAAAWRAVCLGPGQRQQHAHGGGGGRAPRRGDPAHARGMGQGRGDGPGGAVFWPPLPGSEEVLLPWPLLRDALRLLPAAQLLSKGPHRASESSKARRCRSPWGGRSHVAGAQGIRCWGEGILILWCVGCLWRPRSLSKTEPKDTSLWEICHNASKNRQLRQTPLPPI